MSDHINNSQKKAEKLSPAKLRQLYLDFFAGKITVASGVKVDPHAVVPSSPLVPENDPTTLFTGSGMQPMVPYLLGEKHPKGNRITDIQKCFRAEDIEEVGDNRHTTFFEMMGNWSLGDYFRKEQLPWIFAFFTEIVGLDPKRLYVTVFKGSQEYGINKDKEAVEIWKNLFADKGIEAKDIAEADKKGMQGGRIFYYGFGNWWSRIGQPKNMPVGEPGGPDSEIFYDFGPELKLHQNSEFKDQPCHVNCDCGRFLELGNSVFMQFRKTDQGFEELPNKNIDFGGGFERILAAANDDPDVFKTQAFRPIIAKLEQISGQSYDQSSEEVKSSFRVIADHMRAAVMLASDGVFPSNKEQGYFSRRLLRRAIRYGKMIGIEKEFIGELVEPVVAIFKDIYTEVDQKMEQIKKVLVDEEKKFRRTLEKGLREFDKLVAAELTGEIAFKLYESFGFPLELSIEEAEKRQIKISQQIKPDFQDKKQAHADQSRTASAGMFKGGLENESEITTKYHTATHLLHAALRQVLGETVQQKGSNINAKRLRFDFSFDRAVTEQEKQQIQNLINDWIKQDLPVTKQVMQKDQALKSGAIAFFVEKYPDQVNVYSIGANSENEFVSKELCGGPHVESTGQIGELEIFKEKFVSVGVRRIYARLKK